MAFTDLGDWSSVVGLQLPIKGKTYNLPLVSAELGIRIIAIMQLGENLKTGQVTDADRELLSDEEERSLYQDILGPVHAEFVADGVPWAWLKHAATTAMIDVVQGRALAEVFWKTGLGKLGPANKPARKPADRRPRKATATKTPRASTAGTTTSRAKKTTTATRGRSSSRSGA